MRRAAEYAGYLLFWLASLVVIGILMWRAWVEVRL